MPRVVICRRARMASLLWLPPRRPFFPSLVTLAQRRGKYVAYISFRQVPYPLLVSWITDGCVQKYDDMAAQDKRRYQIELGKK